MILTGGRRSKKLDILFCGLPVGIHMQCNRTYRISAFYRRCNAFGKALTMPKGPPCYQSHIRGLLPKYIKVCPAILYKLLLDYANL